MDGIINILKPPGMTSHDVVGWMRRLFKEKRIGHTGTLDPDAVGVLPICVGKATKVVDDLMEKRKKYRAQLILGITTDTLDASGQIIEQRPVEVNSERVVEVVRSFQGKIKQVPPMHSAIKVGGKKLYEYARKGVEIERAAREVEIYSVDVISVSENKKEFVFDVECSKGTYIRSLCADVGETLGCGGHMRMLIRLASGIFDIESSFTLDEIEKLFNEGHTSKFLIPVDTLYKKLPKVVAKDSSLKWVVNGGEIFQKDLERSVSFENDALIRIYDTKGQFMAIYRANIHNGRISFTSYKMFV